MQESRIKNQESRELHFRQRRIRPGRTGQPIRLRSGQVMIMTVLTLGATLLGATTIAGLLMLYQIRQATDLANSSRALSAADAGVEWGLYNVFCDPTVTAPCPSTPLNFSNRASVVVTCSDGLGNALSCTDPAVRSQIHSIRGLGRMGEVTRALEARF